MQKSILTRDSRVGEVYRNPIGHDIIQKILLQMGKSEKLINHPLIGRMKLKTLGRLAKPVLGENFLDVFLQLLNSETEPLAREAQPIKPTWWKESVVYQIYPRSFKDANEDGIGDLNGIIEKLDYLKELGVDIIWLSPIYDSPNDDNGYDIRDYRKIMAEFGTMEDFDRLLEGIHQRGMRLIMDLVINHTSDEHEWFRKSVTQPDSPYGDYYIWRESPQGVPPNNWTSFFSGSAWEYNEERQAWSLHIFSKKQMDLNWENTHLRFEIYDMIKFWLDKGIDGFRLDVINFISKKPGLPDGDENIGKLMAGYYGIEHYFYGPRLHEYLQEMRRETFDHYDVVTVGETPGVGMEMSRLLTSEKRGELDMVFCFDHLENPGKVRFEDYRYDLNYLKNFYTYWMLNYGNDCWMTLFFENHDNPRMISKVNPDPQYREVLGKLLAMLQMTLKGTPFIYQGQELGMVNASFTAIDQLRDVESINLYHSLVPEIGEEKAFQKVLSGSRDHARTPMQWSTAPYGGFSDARPWIAMGEDYLNCNAEDALKNPRSILNFYKKLMALRKEDKTLVYGDFAPVALKKKDVFCYYRKRDGKQYYIELNLSSKSQKRPVTIPSGARLILSNYIEKETLLRPYEANLYRVEPA